MHLGWLAVDQFVAAVRGRPTLTWLGWPGESVALVRGHPALPKRSSPASCVSMCRLRLRAGEPPRVSWRV